MPSQRVAILNRVMARLGDAAKPANLVAVEKSRFRPVQGLQAGQAKQLVYLATETPEEVATSTTDRELRIRVVTQAIPAVGATADDAVDPFLSWPVQQLVSDPVLNGGEGAIASGVFEGQTTWPDDTEGIVDAGVGAAVQEFRILYSTDYNNPETPA